ncbi:tRNA (adenosine(37)-N6)-threonylcarbamoyltransferase complex transferase subunit TsaD [Candidatus Saccharibacteria bacterium]|nr:tRNA (adenosine(37)-N6)-threonylcarbamoyltransferase complex transferase subunit TsaD [Candidatus Saccharibacteria bacterium]
MYILGIETSCDETAASVVKDGQTILSNVVVSQIDIFKEYGGVIPEVAARSHLEAILPVIHEAIRQAEKTDPEFYARNHTEKEKECTLSLTDIDAIAVTHTPGLLGSLLIGTLTARTLAILHHKPLYPVHHLKSHIYANWLESKQPENQSIDFPLLALVVSGGHTQIIRMLAHNQFEIIGTTRDDAVGECFDKVAKILGLPYPGGPSISKAAKNGNPKKYRFPHPKLSSPNRGETKYSSLDFSFSGLKTAVLREVQKAAGKPISFPSHELKNLLSEQQIADFAASFEETATDILIENLQKALTLYPDTKSICLAGGVSANELLRSKSKCSFERVDTEIAKGNFQGRDNLPFEKLPLAIPVFFPSKSLSGDNAAMVAAAAYYEIQSGVQPTDPYHVSLSPRSPITAS